MAAFGVLDFWSRHYSRAVLLFLAAAVWLLFFSKSAPSNGNPSDWVGNGQVKGNPDAKVIVAEFSDFQCPACGAAFPVVQSVFEKYKDRIRFAYRHFPLTTVHPFAFFAAEASECMAEQEKFWEFHDALFQQQSSWSGALDLSGAKQRIREIAVQLDADADSFDSCMADRRYLPKIQQSMDTANRLGVNATPTFFINGKKFSRVLSVQEFEQEIESALSSA